MAQENVPFHFSFSASPHIQIYHTLKQNRKGSSRVLLAISIARHIRTWTPPSACFYTSCVYSTLVATTWTYRHFHFSTSTILTLLTPSSSVSRWFTSHTQYTGASGKYSHDLPALRSQTWTRAAHVTLTQAEKCWLRTPRALDLDTK